MKPKLRIMVIGHARHGKDTCCHLLRDIYGLSFISSSYFVAERAVRPYLSKLGINYNSLQDCYADRMNHRDKWFDAIAAYNAADLARLGRELFSQYDIYCGIRNPLEFEQLKKERAFDVCWWVDRGLLIDPEPITSNKMTKEHADFVLDNNGNLDYLRRNVISLYSISQKFVSCRNL